MVPAKPARWKRWLVVVTSRLLLAAAAYMLAGMYWFGERTDGDPRKALQHFLGLVLCGLFLILLRRGRRS